MYFLQKFYSIALSPLLLLSDRMNLKLRNMLIFLTCLFCEAFFIVYYDYHYKELVYLKHTQNHFILSGCLLVLILCGIKRPLKKVKWVPLLVYLIFFAGFGMLAVSFLHPIGDGYRLFGIMLMVLYPCLFYVWNNNGDYNILFKRLTASTALVGMCVFFYCIFLALQGKLNLLNGRIYGFFYNSNLFSMIGMIMVCSAAYMFMVNQKDFGWFFLSSLSFAAGWTIMLGGVSRASILVGIGSTFAMIIFGVKTSRMVLPARTQFESFVKILILALITIMLIMIGKAALNTNSSIQNKAYLEKNSKVNSEEASEQVATPQTTDEKIQSASDRLGSIGTDLNTYTAGRINIWKSYASHLNMLGNNIDETDFYALTGSTVLHAHNNFLEYAYRCGIPIACIHLLLELYSGIVCIFFLFKKKYKDPAYLFAVVFMICYAVESLFDIATLPFERHAPFYFYMALIPVFGRLNDIRLGRVSDVDDAERIREQEIREYQKLRGKADS